MLVFVSSSLVTTSVSAKTNLSANEVNCVGDTSNLVPEVKESVEETSTSDYGLTDKTSDGVILHAWCWSCNSIKNSMEDIAKAGYSSVQISPINGIINSEGSMDVSTWWRHYQPTKLAIGNYQVGTEQDFKDMCAEAHKYGVKVIVDVVPNHTSGNRNQVDDSLKKYWRRPNSTIDIIDYNDRFKCTQYDVCGGGLPDMNTEDQGYQDLFISYLNNCVDCGADGFRYDTAKHIGLPDDPSGGDFWPEVTSAKVKNISNLFVYLEVLQDSNSRSAVYSKFGSVTASGYSAKIRNSIKSNKLNVNEVGDYNSQSVDLNKIVVWAESHDNFANDPKDDPYSQSTWMTEDNVKMAWAFVTARAKGTPLFYARPKGAGNYVRFPGQNKLGEVGSEQFKAPEVAEVNKFHNAMVGESEYLSNQGDQIALIERGKKGVVIINLGGKTQINTKTTMPDGTYTDQVSGNKFTVSGGNIKGDIDGYKVAVVYNPESTPISGSAKVSASKESGSFTEDSIDIKLSLSGATKGAYSIDKGAATEFKDGQAVTIGKDLEAGKSTTITLSATGENGKEVTKEYTYTKKDPSATVAAYLKMPSGWTGTPKAYIYDIATDKGNDIFPGVEMTKVKDGLYSLEVPKEYSKPGVIFSCGTSRYPADQEKGLAIDGKSMVYDGTDWKEYVIEKPKTKLKAGEVTIEPSKTAKVGDQVKITSESATGGSGKYTYEIKVGDKILGTKTTATWKPEKSGDYEIKVTTTDSDGATDIKTVSYSITDGKTVADQVTITTNYVDQDTDKVIKTTSEKVDKGSNYTTKELKIDGYELAKAPDNKAGVANTDLTVTYEYKATGDVKKGSTTTPTKDELKVELNLSQREILKSDGTTVLDLVANATGGEGELQYKFTSIYNNTKKEIQSYSTEKTAILTISEPGEYKVYVTVKDQAGNQVKSLEQSYSLKAKEVPLDPNKENPLDPNKEVPTGDNVNMLSVIAMFTVAGAILKKQRKNVIKNKQ